MREQSKNYYYDLQTKELESLKAAGKRPTLLLHACCAMCACWPIVLLSEYFDLTIYYYNNNIYPQSEYEKRLGELHRYVDIFNKENNTSIEIIAPEYDNVSYNRQLEPFGNEPEGGQRCRLCFRLRMGKAMEYARDHKFDYFTTVMTISRQKNSVVLNQTGEQLQKEYPEVRYFYSDFKKKAGLEKAGELIRRYDIYRQNYCGCIYSYKEMLVRTSAD